jgi:hypothetical protein
MMVSAPPAYCGGGSVTPKKITAATAARAGSRVLVSANSVGVIRLRLASDRLKATAVAATATIPVRSATTRGSPDGCAVHGGNHTSRGMAPMLRPQAVAGRAPVSRARRAEPSS